MARISRFSPNWSDPEDLEAITVAREDLIAHAVECVRESVLTENKHHLLFVGPRGCGKTHLITLVHYRISKMSELAGGLRIAWLNEDETSDTLLSLLVRIHRTLAKVYPGEFPADSMESVYDLPDRSSAAEAASSLLLEQLGDKVLLVLTENLDSLFRDFTDGEQKRWRALIQNHPQFCTVATAQRLFDEVSTREAPFFGFFHLEHLRPFSVDDAATLLVNIAGVRKDEDLASFIKSVRGRARIRALHHLTGGNQRLFIILSDFINAASLDSLVGPFEALVDEQLTPYYQERLRWLTTPQRRIVEYLCTASKPVPVKAIARHLFSTPQTVSSQLRELRNIGYLTSKPRGRESLYELAEPLMRISHQVKEANGRTPLRLLVDFLRVWYDRDELESRAEVAGEAAPVTLAYFREALALDQKEGNLRLLIFEGDAEAIDLASCDENQLALLRDLKEESNDPEHALQYAMALTFRDNYEETIEAYTRVLDFNPPAFVAAAAYFGRAVAYSGTGVFQAALDDLEAAIQTRGLDGGHSAFAGIFQGLCHLALGDDDAAISILTRYIAMPDAEPERIPSAYFYRGQAYYRHGDSDAAIRDYLSARETLDDGNEPELALKIHFALVDAWIGLGRWVDAFSALRAAFALRCERTWAATTTRVFHYVVAIFNAKNPHDAWGTSVDQLLEIYSEHEATAELAVALVASVGTFRETSRSADDLFNWYELWAERTHGYPELELAVKLLGVGIEFIKSDDPGVLLSLASEERRILEQALGFDEDGSESDGVSTTEQAGPQAGPLTP